MDDAEIGPRLLELLGEQAVSPGYVDAAEREQPASFVFGFYAGETLAERVKRRRGQDPNVSSNIA